MLLQIAADQCAKMYVNEEPKRQLKVKEGRPRGGPSGNFPTDVLVPRH